MPGRQITGFKHVTAILEPEVRARELTEGIEREVEFRSRSSVNIQEPVLWMSSGKGCLTGAQVALLWDCTLRKVPHCLALLVF